MINWNNLDTLNSFKELSKTEPVDLPEVMSGESGAERALNYSIPMAEGLSFNYAASAVDEDTPRSLKRFTTAKSLTRARIAWFFISSAAASSERML